MGKFNINLLIFYRIAVILIVVAVLIVVNTLRKDELNPKMVLVEGNSIIQNANLNNGPIATNDFLIGKYEVTQASYNLVMGENPSHFKRIDRHLPVEQLSWNKAVKFCNELSKKAGLDTCYYDFGESTKCNFEANGYRLPTMNEWSFAAQGGMDSKSYKYPGSNEGDQVIWYADNAKDTPHKVGTKKGNELGIHDMGGNVNEWCWDGSRENSERYYCGGSFECNDNYCVFTSSHTAQPDSCRYDLGLRLCRSSR